MPTAKVLKIKTKKCKVCKEKYAPFNSTQKACSGKCALELVRQDAKRREDKAHRERKREFRNNDKSQQRKAAQHAFNAFIRERDKGLPCISCEKPKDWGGQWHAGHYKTVGARPDLRFNEDNCHKQCSVCNNYHSGNLVEYSKNLVRRIGLNKFESLERVETVKRTAEDYRNIAQYYRDKLKREQHDLHKRR